MSRAYDSAMQKHGQSERKKRKQKIAFRELELSTAPLFREASEPAIETSWKRDISLPDHVNEGMKSQESCSIYNEDFPSLMYAVGIGTSSNHVGQEFSGITDRISKLLSDYDEVYEDKDQLGYAAMKEQLSGQVAMERLLSHYKSLCREREELLNSLQDSLDMDEDEILDELEKLNKENFRSVDMEGAQQAIRDSFQNIKSTTNKLQQMNQQMLILTKKGQRNEKLEEEKRQLENELQMYKKVAVQQRKDIVTRRSSMLKDQTQQWKLVAGEMVDMLTTVRSAGNLDRETLETELNRVLMMLNSQTEYIDSLKTDLTKQEKAYQNLEKDKNRLNNDKVLVESQLRSKQQELKHCKEYLRKLIGEKRYRGQEKIKTDQEENDLTSSTSEATVKDDGGTTGILQAQITDARKLVTKLEEENRELQRKLAAQSSSTELRIDQENRELQRKLAAQSSSTELRIDQENRELQRKLAAQSSSTELRIDQKAATLQATTEPTGAADTEAIEATSSHECPQCLSYQAQISNQTQELKNKEDLIEQLKKDLEKLRALLTSTEGASRAEAELSFIDEDVQEERLEDQPAPEMEDAAPSELQVSSGNESSEEEPKVKTKETAKLTVPKGDLKKRTAKSPRKPKNKEEAKDKEKEPNKKGAKRTGYRRKRVLVDECREEKAPYVKVREARMVTLANKGTQSSHYDNLTEGTTQRNSIGWQLPGSKRLLAETIMAGVTPNEMQQETNAAMSFIKEQADRLCDDISSFVDCGFDIVEQGAKTNRINVEAQLGQNAVEGLDSDDVTLQLERANTGPRRQSFFANKRRRSSINFERRGTRKHSILPLFDGHRRELRENSVTGQCRLLDSSIKESGEETVNQQTPLQASANGQLETEKRATEQGPPQALVNPLFPDQQTAGEAGQDSEEKELLPCTETRARGGALTLPAQETFDAKQVFDPAFMKSNPWSTLNNFVESIISSDGTGCSQVVNAIKRVVEGSGLIPTEDQIREQVKVTAQHAIDTIQSTADILSHQLQTEADKYEKCYHLFGGKTEKQETSPRAHDMNKRDGPKKIFTSVDNRHTRDSDITDVKDPIFFPPIVTQDVGTRVRVAPATAELSRKGMLVIQASGHRPTGTPPPSTSNSKMRKRGKLARHSRRQMLLKQKEVKDKELSTRISQQYKQYHPIHQGIPLTKSQDFYHPLETYSVALPTLPQGMQMQRAFDHQQRKAEPWKKAVPHAEPAKGIANEQETPTLPGVTITNTVWQSKNSVIPKFSSEKAIRHSFSELQTKLPHLNINQIQKVGQ